MAFEFSLVVFAFSAGAFSFFAPCAYPLLPGYISYYIGRTAGTSGKDPDRLRTRIGRAVIVGVLVSAGIFAVYGIFAGIVVLLGTRILAGVSVLELVVGTLLIGMGAAMANGWTAPIVSIPLPVRRQSVAGYFGFGVLYAAAAAGCTAPIAAGVVVAGVSAGPSLGLVTVVAYAAGTSTLAVGITVATAVGREAIFSVLTRNTDRIHRAAGVLLVLAGALEIYLFLFRFDGWQLLSP